MAPVPASLKPIQQYLNKANEMKNADPVVSYYCNYWAVQYAISLGLKDPEANVFLASLLDSLESTKRSMASTEAITDEIVGKAYMENFSGNIFTAADDEERARKATRTTAAKFLAAAQFMEVLQCFGDLDKETSDKIKYAKFQCARILRAIKAGEDPNVRMPEVEDEPVPVLPYVSPTRTNPPQLPTQGEPPVTQPMNRGPSGESQHSSTSVPTIPPSISPDSTQPSGYPPPGGFSAGTQNSFGLNMRSTSPSGPFPPGGTASTSSPGLPAHPWAPPQNPPPPSLGGTSTFPGQLSQRHSPPSGFPPSFPNSSSPPPPPPNQFSPPVPPPRPTSQPPSNYYTQSPIIPPSNYGSGQPSAPPRPPSNYAPSQPSAPPLPSNYYSQRPQPPMQHAPTPSYFPPQPPPQPQLVVDDEAIAKAQKHAKWAISALNYEDVDTAVKELKNALNTLGVRYGI